MWNVYLLNKVNNDVKENCYMAYYEEKQVHYKKEENFQHAFEEKKTEIWKLYYDIFIKI